MQTAIEQAQMDAVELAINPQMTSLAAMDEAALADLIRDTGWKLQSAMLYADLVLNAVTGELLRRRARDA